MKKRVSLVSLVCLMSLFQWACSSAPVSPPSHIDSLRTPTSTDRSLYPLNTKFETALDDEAILVDQIRNGMLAIQASNKKVDGHQAHRGTHAKGICAKAQMEIFDETQWNAAIVNRIKKGIFSVPGVYPAQVRFANAEGKIQSDGVDDVRAVSFSMRMPPSLSNAQGTMDFSLNNAPFFPIGNAQIFADLMTFAQNQSPVDFYQKVGAVRANAVIWALGLGKFQETLSGHTIAYQKMRFWSDVPFALGEDEAVKYSLKPCGENQAEPLTTDKKNPKGVPNSLAIELKRSLQNDNPPSCFDFQIQLLEAGRMRNHLGIQGPPSYWVENSDVEWNEDQAPFYTVGRLTLAHGPAIDDMTCENWHINVTANTNAIHHGLGSLNRARGAAESASAAVRLGK